LSRYLIHLFFLAVIGILMVGCNSSNIPINPPDASHGGNQQNQGNDNPNPPTPPTNPQAGQYDTLTANILFDKNFGKVPLQIVFNSEVAGGLAPYKYFWDFDSNGVTDSVDPAPSCVYASPGIYQAKLTIEDDAGALAVQQVEIEARFPNPNARPEALPITGAAPLDVNFIAENSKSQAGASIVEYKWDFQPDGIWDYVDTATGNTAFTYDEPGNYYPVLYVKDNLGLWEEASLHIIVTF
jgi:PKD repeat protein